MNTLIFGNMAIVKRLYLVTSANRIAMELRTTFTTSRILKVLSSEKKVALLGSLGYVSLKLGQPYILGELLTALFCFKSRYVQNCYDLYIYICIICTLYPSITYIT